MYEQSLYNRFFSNSELEEEIDLDLTRTYLFLKLLFIQSHPDVPFFQERKTQTEMKHILFVYSRAYPDVSYFCQMIMVFRYRQGMHELVATVYFAVTEESKAQKPDADSTDETDKVHFLW